MTTEQLLKNLKVPSGKIDMILDTDAYNEIDDQYAIAYMLKNKEKLNVKAIYAAPFFNNKSVSPEDGMEKSYDEILKILKLAKCEDIEVFKGSRSYLSDEKTPVESEAALHLCKLAMNYSPQKPLYVVAIGAITNIASAILLKPEIKENIVVVWLGGNGMHMDNTVEFNLSQDIASARIIFGSGVPFVQLPCAGVVSEFRVSGPELEYWLKDKTELSTYLAENTIREAESYAAGKPWTRVIWDVTAIGWLLNDGDRFMQSKIITAPVVSYDNLYSPKGSNHFMRYVYSINRDALMEDLFKKITQ